MINGPTSNGFGKDIFRKMARDLYGRLKAYEDIAELCGGADRLRELAEADKDGRVVVLPPENYDWKIRGDIALGIITANYRRAEAERAMQEMEGKKDGNETNM